MPMHQNMPWNPPFEAWRGESRKRHSEVVGGRRPRLWEEASGSWGGNSTRQKRRKWKPEDEMPKKSKISQAIPSYPLFSFFSRDSLTCDNLELLRRYPHLHIPAALFHLQLCWPETFPPGQPFPIMGSCHFHIAPGQTATTSDEPASDEAASEEPASDETAATEPAATKPAPAKPAPTKPAPTPVVTDSSFSVKVMLLSLPSIEGFYSQCCNLDEDEQAPKEMVHPTTLFKFLLLEKAEKVELPGGAWSPDEDGPSPAKDSSTLVHTAIRYVKEQMDLDLSSCTQWHKMAELKLLSDDKVETIVIMMPDVWNLMQTTEEWAKFREEWKDEASPLPDHPSLIVRPQEGYKLTTVSLSSLLKPRNTQTQDNFEVGFISEMFSEMLQRDFGLQLYSCLSALPVETPATPENSNAAQKDKVEQTDKEQTDKPKESDANKEVNEDEEIEDESILLDEQDQMETETEGDKSDGVTGDDDKPQKDNDEEEECLELPRKVLLSWVFFDKHLSGHLREKDLQHILLSLGLYLTTYQAQALVKKVMTGGRCVYHKMCSNWVDSEDVVHDFSAEGNKSLLVAKPTKEKGNRRSAATNSEVVTFKGTTLNIPNLLQSLEHCKTAQHDLEKRLAELQTELEEAKATPSATEQEQLKNRLQKAESLNKTYEKNLKDNSSHMITFIEKMHKMVDQTTVLMKANK